MDPQEKAGKRRPDMSSTEQPHKSPKSRRVDPLAASIKPCSFPIES